MPATKVLITGAAGRIGSAIWRTLELEPRRYKLSGLDTKQAAGRAVTIGDISEMTTVRGAVEGQEVVVHMAADPSGHAPWESVLRNNIIGTYNVFEASRLAGVKRIVFASTCQVVWNHEGDFPYSAIVEGRYNEVPANYPLITKDWPVRPWGLYAAAKAWGEDLGRCYSDRYGISVVCLRIGAVNTQDKPLSSVRHFAIWCSQRDVAQLAKRCIDAPSSLKFDVFFAVSNNKWRIWDIEHARRVVGFQPQDNAEDWRQRFEAQGGGAPVKAGILP
ncbi:MAG: NAD(P)-dependent oxidoreductase [Chloroflexota bacterium]|nr:NAD(P)-dependent oxidoreductase [Chloroflexota bacterium]